jgi:UDP-N-acetylmuramoyl-L-alanyl-D-glutamate--2,6-diaminopimelate ligase
MSMPAETLMTSITLNQLLQGFVEAPAIEIKGIASDSRQLCEGGLFLACKGAQHHGLEFVDAAITAGVAAIAYDASTADAVPAEIGTPLIGVPQLAQRLGEIANRFYGHPSEQLEVFAVTGTNGKTTVASMIAQCLQRLDLPCAYLGTLNNALTTPPVVELHGILAEFRDHGATQAAIEVSSHALAQNRLDGVTIDTALFTNLSRDHLDYHADMRDYGETKARLFLECKPAHSIINIDDAFGAELAMRCGKGVTVVSTRKGHAAHDNPYVCATGCVAHSNGFDVVVASSFGDGQYSLMMPGEFNVANSALTLALLLHKGVSMDDACNALSAVRAPAGRMQAIDGPEQAPSVYVDFAHTPDALEAALQALRVHSNGRIWVVFGCGGDRDNGKRAMMGSVAQRLADQVVVTSDNPRNEPVPKIIDDIVAGLASPSAATVIEDRATAIAWAISSAAAADIVLIAGKGHEQYQQVAAERIPFSDQKVAAACLAARGHGA